MGETKKSGRKKLLAVAALSSTAMLAPALNACMMGVTTLDAGQDAQGDNVAVGIDTGPRDAEDTTDVPVVDAGITPQDAFVGADVPDAGATE